MTDNRTCVICLRALEAPAMACTSCSNRIDATLVEIGHHHADLPDHLQRGQSGGPKVSGSREAPLPLRVDPLDLSLAAPAGRQRWTPLNLADQIGHESVLAILDSWVRDWRDIRNRGEGLPVPAGASLISWLRVRLDWATAQHPAIDDFAEEMHQTRSALRRALGITGGRPDFLDVPCRRCDWLSLGHVPRADRVECAHCGDLSTGEEFHRWAGLMAIGVWEGTVEIDFDKLLYVDEAALLVKVKETVIRQWAARGVLPIVERQYGRPRFRVGDVFEAERRTRAGVLAS